jgi:hypothetical protein
MILAVIILWFLAVAVLVHGLITAPQVPGDDLFDPNDTHDFVD